MDYIIIGTDHRLQRSDSTDSGLKNLLRGTIAAHPVVLVAEEVKTKDVQTFGRELIGDSKWLPIDMTEQERKDAGIDEILRSGGPVQHPVTGLDVRCNAYHKKSEGVRENFWLDMIEQWCEDHNVSSGAIVITCGHNHLNFLATKIESRGHTAVKFEYLPYDKEAEHGLFTIYDD